MAHKEPARRRKSPKTPRRASVQPPKASPLRGTSTGPEGDAAKPRRPAIPPARRGGGKASGAPAEAPAPLRPPRAPRVAPETLDLGPASEPVLGDIPWGYGDTRITAMARDPHWVFAYWEVTDEAITAAREEVEAQDAGCTLRVNETTHRLFDGTNANWYFDIPVDRAANRYYVHVGHPGATVHIDIGVKSREGYFAKVARSGAVETPRDSIAAAGQTEWLTVIPDGVTAPEYRHRFAPRPVPPGAGREPGVEGIPEGELDRVIRSLIGEGWTRTEWTETEMGGRVVRWVRWSGPIRYERWRLAHGGGFARIEVLFEGEERVVRAEHAEQVVFGPWRVEIYGLDPWGERRLFDRWTLHYAWATEGAVRVQTEAILWKVLHGYRRVLVPLGSEGRLGAEAWSSEALQVGASEWRWAAAGEAWLGGASEQLRMGASELALSSASEMAFAEAWAMAYLGASEALFGGASEGLRSGASEFLAGFSGDWPPYPSSETRP